MSKMFEVLSGMSGTGQVGEHTILAAMQSNDDPLRAFIVRAVNSHSELLSLLKETATNWHHNNPQHKGYLSDCKKGDCLTYLQAIARAEGTL